MHTTNRPSVSTSSIPLPCNAHHDGEVFSRFSRMFVRMPLYVSQWLRTKYMPAADRLAPIRIPITHPAGRIVYTSLIPNTKLKKLSPICYSAQMFGIPTTEIPYEYLDNYPDPDTRFEYEAIALPASHYFHGRWIDDSDTMQLSSRDAAAFCDILLKELWSDVITHWQEYKVNHSINHPDRVPVFYDFLLDFCDLYHINVDSVEPMHRAYKRLMKKQKGVGSTDTPGK